jgi:cobyrinic acid a,c-diamide synthase
MKFALLAGTQSGCGKTTIMLALLQRLTKHYQSVSSFKAGPDFLDPLWHQAVTTTPSYNLDTRMIGVELSRQILAKQSQQSELGLIEGVMGLFDGREGVGEAGSSLDLAKQLACPVILVVDTKGMSGSIVPLVSGFCQHAENKGVLINGIVANQVGSEHHAKILRTLLTKHNMPPLVAWMLKDAPPLVERHLGLMRPAEVEMPDYSDSFFCDDTVLAQLLRPCHHYELQQTADCLRRLQGKTVAVAKDDACCFIYPANIDWLQEQGAEIVYFSPLNGEQVPEQSDALWLPGGYPELYAQQLSQSRSLRSIYEYIEGDKPVLAECGGAMLLGQHLISQDGCAWPMAAVLPYDSRMHNKLVSLGYRQEKSGVRGHEFHHSKREMLRAMPPAFACDRGDVGVKYKNLKASYIHWYFPSQPDCVAQWFNS